MSLFLIGLLFAVGLCDAPPWLGQDTRIQTKGFSIYGVQCGTSLDLLIKRLGGNWKCEVIAAEPSDYLDYYVQDYAGHGIIVSIPRKEAKRPLCFISAFPISETISVELDGKQVVYRDDSIQSIEARIGRKAKETEQGIYEFKCQNQLLTLSFDGEKLDAVEMSKVAP